MENSVRVKDFLNATSHLWESAYKFESLACLVRSQNTGLLLKCVFFWHYNRLGQ